MREITHLWWEYRPFISIRVCFSSTRSKAKQLTPFFGMGSEGGSSGQPSWPTRPDAVVEGGGAAPNRPAKTAKASWFRRRFRPVTEKSRWALATQ
jgi:hypothetical protein